MVCPSYYKKNDCNKKTILMLKYDIMAIGLIILGNSRVFRKVC